MGNVGSVQFQIVPCSSLYLFSRSIDPLECLVNVNYRVLICCTCHFQIVGSLFFVYFGLLFLQVSSVSNFCPDTEGEGGHLLRLTCSVVLWEGRDTANIAGVYGEHSQYMDHTGFAPAQGGLCFPGPHCSGSRVLCRALHFVHFPGLSLSSPILSEGTDLVGHAFCALPRPECSGDQVLGEHTVPGGAWILITSLVPAVQFHFMTNRWGNICHHFMASGETMKTVRDFVFWGSKITADDDCGHAIERKFNSLVEKL